jgi:hypothetical protein
VTSEQPSSDQPSEPPAEPDGVRYGRVRRAPRYGSFVVTGAVIGAVIGLVLSVSRPSTGQFSQNSVIGYVAATLGLLGALLGAGVAVLLDRRRPATPDSRQKARTDAEPR